MENIFFINNMRVTIILIMNLPHLLLSQYSNMMDSSTDISYQMKMNVLY